MKKKIMIALGIAAVSTFAMIGIIQPNDPTPPKPMAVFQLLN